MVRFNNILHSKIKNATYWCILPLMFLVYIINNKTQVSFRDLYYEMILKLRHDFYFQDVEWRNIWVLFVRERSGIRPGIYTHVPAPQQVWFDGVHNNKDLGLTQSKRLAYWVRTAPTFILCSPTINFRCGTNPTISPSSHVHNLEGYYKLRVQFSCHKDFRDLMETLTVSPVNVWPRDIFTHFSIINMSIRASPRVCQNLLDKFCVLPTSKKLCKVKKEFISNSLA
jgi:hypothetical protein